MIWAEGMHFDAELLTREDGLAFLSRFAPERPLLVSKTMMRALRKVYTDDELRAVKVQQPIPRS